MMLLPFILATAAQTISAVAPQQPAEKIICKREAITGSLAGFRKTCHTETEWRKIADIAVRNGQQIIDRGTIGCGLCNGPPPGPGG